MSKDKKKKDKSDLKLLEVSTESGDESSAATDFDPGTVMEMMKHLMTQDQKRAEKELKREEQAGGRGNEMADENGRQGRRETTEGI